MQVQSFYDAPTFTLSYVVWDPGTRDAVIIDPVLNYDPLGSQTSPETIDDLSKFILSKDLHVHWVLETHAHADHLTGAQLLKRRFSARVVIGEKITTVQKTFQHLFDLPSTFKTNGSQFDRLIRDGERLSAGTLTIEAIATPGHTPACMSYKIGNAVFTGDALFMHDYGTGRTDFPGGSAEDLYRSIHDRLYQLPEETRVFVGHDYQPGGRELRFETTIGQSKRSNPQLSSETTESRFVALRTERDASLQAPRLLYQSVQVNINAGVLPEKHDNGNRYLTMPLNLFGPTDDVGEPS